VWSVAEDTGVDYNAETGRPEPADLGDHNSVSVETDIDQHKFQESFDRRQTRFDDDCEAAQSKHRKPMWLGVCSLRVCMSVLRRETRVSSHRHRGRLPTTRDLRLR
jgi:hypothetical protein